mmetsp:Transcript_20212/g.33368  ORF Transcript_20212/g.33368 Transcript_20212/m.33368 type:complete len:616 (-) Transcript_20212:573-2420(-)|eukprot:CAMPEP_0203765696 /NCGR_PEP_ID=MMETSP0099_2-20121227/9_1 /ASSEMBLY_ACC=CAM_ASM_000209 /TAXON_ID=96639 /ORGANISM=" , Strain NY0313808BC1" /LENGTH=615 /DNA_ID=CAMNT_0050661971 /DNA_START=225 /DNA_END=2072 /DNA_ORIENTATION=+
MGNDLSGDGSGIPIGANGITERGDGDVLINFLDKARFGALRLDGPIRHVVAFCAERDGPLVYLVLGDGRVRVWNAEANQVLGTQESVSLMGVGQIDCGEGHFVALARGGSLVLSWGGKDGDCQLGRGGSATSVEKVVLDCTKQGVDTAKVTQVSCGANHTLCLDKTGRVYTWGIGEYGRLGLGDSDSRDNPVVISSFLESKVRVIQVSAGQQHSLALTADCRVFSWGNGSDGKLGHGCTRHEFSPREIEGYKQLRNGETVDVSSQYPLCHISAGTNHSAVLSSAGYIFTFGKNSHNQLGHATSPRLLDNCELSPTLVGCLSDEHVFITTCACSTTFTLAQTNDGKMVVFGVTPRGENVMRVKPVGRVGPQLPSGPRYVELRRCNSRPFFLCKSGYLTRRTESVPISPTPKAGVDSPLLMPPTPRRGLVTVTHRAKQASPHGVCNYHATYSELPCNTRGSTSTHLIDCAPCAEEIIYSLSRQLRETTSQLQSIQSQLEVERRDVSHFRELSSRKAEPTNNPKNIVDEIDEDVRTGVMSKRIEKMQAELVEQEQKNKELTQALEVALQKVSKLEQVAKASLHTMSDLSDDDDESTLWTYTASKTPFVDEYLQSKPNV